MTKPSDTSFGGTTSFGVTSPGRSAAIISSMADAPRWFNFCARSGETCPSRYSHCPRRLGTHLATRDVLSVRTEGGIIGNYDGLPKYHGFSARQNELAPIRRGPCNGYSSSSAHIYIHIPPLATGDDRHTLRRRSVAFRRCRGRYSRSARF